MSLIASVVVCETGGKDWLWFGPLWNLLAMVDSPVGSVCGD